MGRCRGFLRPASTFNSSNWCISCVRVGSACKCPIRNHTHCNLFSTLSRTLLSISSCSTDPLLVPPSLGHICYYFFAIACGAPVFPYIKSHINLGGNFSGSFQPPPHTPPPLINTVSGHPSVEQLGIEEVHLVGQYV